VSVEVTLDLAGVAEFQQTMARFDVGMQRQVQEQLANWAETVKIEASRLVPVKTGYLRSTIFARIQEWTADVGAEASYASSVEFGTRYARAQPFLQPAVQERLPELERVLLAAVDFARAEAGL
jgi:HK97 gp10 family phage protein